MNRFEKLISAQPRARKGAGAEYMLSCPFHSDSTPSLHVNVQKGLWKCFGCGEKGNAAKLVKALRPNLNWEEASQYFEGQSGRVDSERVTVKLPSEYAEILGIRTRGQERDKAYEYLIGRGLSSVLIHDFRLGYCVTGPYAKRVIVPIYTEGILRSFAARDYTGKAPKKVLYPKGAESAKALFGYDRAVALNAPVVVVTEGWGDALSVLVACSQSAVVNKWASVALGTSQISSDQVLLLSKFSRFVVALDNDAAGRRGTKQVAESLSLCGKVALVDYDGVQEKDPGGMRSEQLIRVLSSSDVRRKLR